MTYLPDERKREIPKGCRIWFWRHQDSCDHAGLSGASTCDAIKIECGPDSYCLHCTELLSLLEELREKDEALEDANEWRDASLMRRYALGWMAECDMDEAVAEACGGFDSLPFENWWYDDYDSSVELVAVAVGWTPTQETLAKLRTVGIYTMYVSYQDGTAKAWSQASSGTSCSPRESKRDKRGLLRKLFNENAQLRRDLEEREDRIRQLERGGI